MRIYWLKFVSACLVLAATQIAPSASAGEARGCSDLVFGSGTFTQSSPEASFDGATFSFDRGGSDIDFRAETKTPSCRELYYLFCIQRSETSSLCVSSYGNKQRVSGEVGSGYVQFPTLATSESPDSYCVFAEAIDREFTVADRAPDVGCIWVTQGDFASGSFE